MQTKSLLKEGLAIGIILLFIGVVVAPSINSTVVKASNDNDLVEVTSQACGIQGFGNTTVKLTKEQYQNLEQYLVDFRARLNQTSSREEAVPLFKDAVVELNKYGLLPKGMSIEQAQKLVTSQYQAKHMEDFQEKLAHNRLLRLENDSNLFCLIAGNTSNVFVFGLLSWIPAFTSFFSLIAWVELTKSLGEWLLGCCFGILCLITGFLTLCSLPLLFSPVKLLSMIFVGGGQPTQPATGWVATFGLNGVKYFSDEMYGQLFSPFLIGGVGFTGISLLIHYNIDNYNQGYYSVFLGAALAVKIGPNLPWT